MGVVVRRYIGILIIIITFPYSTCILAAASLLLCSFLKCFFRTRDIFTVKHFPDHITAMHYQYHCVKFISDIPVSVALNHAMCNLKITLGKAV